MPSGVSWKLEGFYDRAGTQQLTSGLITNAFTQFGIQSTRAMLNRLLPQLAAAAKVLCPRSSLDKEHLQDSIEWFVSPTGLWGAYGSNMHYAAYVEWGWSGMPVGKHFLTGALNVIKMQNLGG